jgi:hypothetical protein
MDPIDDMFERKIGKRQHGYYHRDYGSHHESRHFLMGFMNSLLGRISYRKSVLLLVGGLLIAIVVVLILLAITLLPFASQTIAYLNENGLKGIFETVQWVIDRLWEGTGKK